MVTHTTWIGVVNGMVLFTVQHASVYHRHYARTSPWRLYRETGYGGAEAFRTAEDAKCWASKLNPKVVWSVSRMPSNEGNDFS